MQHVTMPEVLLNMQVGHSSTRWECRPCSETQMHGNPLKGHRQMALASLCRGIERAVAVNVESMEYV